MLIRQEQEEVEGRASGRYFNLKLADFLYLCVIHIGLTQTSSPSVCSPRT